MRSVRLINIQIDQHSARFWVFSRLVLALISLRRRFASHKMCTALVHQQLGLYSEMDVDEMFEVMHWKMKYPNFGNKLYLHYV